LQQAEHITESEVDIEKKKQELYSEIDALGIKSDSRINKLKKFLADRKIWHLEEMDYPLRNSYEQYLRGQIRSQIVSFYLKIYDTVKQQHIYQQMQTLNGKRIYEWKYQNKIYFLKYYPEEVRIKKIAREAALMAQSGQYNYNRMFGRGEKVTADIALAEFLKHTMSMIYLLNRRFAPFYKWMHRGLREMKVIWMPASTVIMTLLIFPAK